MKDLFDLIFNQMNNTKNSDNSNQFFFHQGSFNFRNSNRRQNEENLNKNEDEDIYRDENDDENIYTGTGNDFFDHLIYLNKRNIRRETRNNHQYQYNQRFRIIKNDNVGFPGLFCNFIINIIKAFVTFMMISNTIAPYLFENRRN